MTEVKNQDGEALDPHGGDYFVVCTSEANWYVSAVMARAIEEALREEHQARWVTFVDLSGARIRVRARLIHFVAQCYAANRSAERRFWRSHKRETRSDREWDDD